MTPIDTHHDSLGIYYDFLEESGNDTSELRQDLVTHKKYYYEMIHIHFSMRIGSGRYNKQVGGNGCMVGGTLNNTMVGMTIINRVGSIINRGVGSIASSNGNTVGE